MLSFEYVVVPAPKKAPKIKGAKTVEARFAAALSELMNAYGAEGWEYVRSDTLPCEERSGFTGTKTVFQNLLVFRRVLDDGETAYSLPEEDMVETPEQLARTLVTAEPDHIPAPRFTAATRDPVPEPAAPRAAPIAAPETAVEPSAQHHVAPPQPMPPAAAAPQHSGFAQAPRLGAARDAPGPAPRLGPAGDGKPASPRSAADRFEGR